MKQTIRVIWLAVLVAGFLGTSNGIFSQVIPEKTPAEQINAQGVASQIQSYGGQGAYSVSSGGDLGLGVPLVSVRGRKLSLPLRLGYSPGIKVEQKAGPVGLGWGLGFGSIVRDFGDFDPDYTTAYRDETRGKTASGDPVKLAVDGQPPLEYINHREQTVLDGLLPYQFIPDDYHVSAPGLGGNTFWNHNGNERFAWANHSNWRIEFTEKDYEFDQELSRFNELSLGSSVFYNPNNGSHAAAIGMLNIADNARTAYTCISDGGTNVIPLNNYALDLALSDVVWPGLKVEYRDFGSFTITDENGTQYVFGRALRGQKYIFKEDPYWSASSAAQGTEIHSSGSPVYHPAASKGEFWKTEYIAEWLLTEVRSQDYIDANGSGMADAGDFGDWIRVEYTSDTQEIAIPELANPKTFITAKHREFLNFSQTDPASALWRERAYVTRVVTPVQELVVEKEQQFDVDHDYFSKPANGRYQGVPAFNQHYAPEEQRYTSFTLNDRVTGSQIKRVDLLYADQGSPEELAKSSYLIRHNDDTESVIGTAHDMSPYTNGVRGKTTLLGVKHFGSDAADPKTYRFEYGYNPSYTDIHRARMWSELFYPNKRESRAAIQALNPNYTQLIPPHPAGMSEDEFMAYLSWPYTKMYPEMGTLLNPSLVHAGLPITKRMDEMGYYYDHFTGNNGRHAWSLSKLIYPTGGSLEINYERDHFSYTLDRSNWQVKDDELTNVQTAFNHFVTQTATWQDQRVCTAPTPFGYICRQGNSKLYPAHTLTGECKATSEPFHFPLNEFSGGLRVKQTTLDDGAGQRYETQYKYGVGQSGEGRLAEPNSAYWQTFMASFNKHIRIMRSREKDENYRLATMVSISGLEWFNNDFDFFDYQFFSPVRMDIRSECQVLYPVVKTLHADGSSMDQQYRVQPLNQPHIEVRPLKHLGNLQKDVWIIASEKLYGLGDMLGVSYFKTGETTPYATEGYLYSYFDSNSEDLTYMPWDTTGTGNGYQKAYWGPIYAYADDNPNVGGSNEGFVIVNPGDNANHPAYWATMGFSGQDNCAPYFAGNPVGLVIDLFSPQGSATFTRQRTLARTLMQETSTYQGLSTLTQHAYETDHYKRTLSTVYNSTSQTAPQQVNVTETKYAFQKYPAGSVEYQALAAKNMQFLPLENNQYSGDNGTGFSLNSSTILGSSVQTFAQETSFGQDAIYADKAYSFNTRSVDHLEGYIQNFTYFNHPGFAGSSVNSSAGQWTESGSVPIKRDPHGNVTHWETPYHTGKTVYGYQSSATSAIFSNTKGLDASYIGFEDYFEGGTQGYPVRGFGDDWGNTPISYPNQGSYRSTDANSGAWSYQLQSGGGRSPERIFELSPGHYFPANDHSALTEHTYILGFWAKSPASGTSLKAIFEMPNCGNVATSIALPTTNNGQWTYYEEEVLLPLNCGNPTFYIERSDGSPANVLIDDILVYPKGAVFGAQSLDQHRRPTARINTANQIVKSEYDQFGRLKQNYNAKGELLAQYTYRLTDSIPDENSYVEIAVFSGSSGVGIKRAYFDGLGRQKQEISWEPSLGRAIVSGSTEYDVMGRPHKVYSPVPLPNMSAGLPGKFVDDVDLRARTFYGTNFPYTETEYDKTPQSRVLKQYNPRLNWQAHSFFEYDYGVNASTIEGYAPGELLRKETFAEDGSRFVEYLDKFGQAILTGVPTDDGITEEPLGGVIRGGSNLVRIQTKYTYDRAGRLVQTRNPENQLIENWYDSQSKLIQETLPDRGKTAYRYDRFGRLRFVQDAEDRNWNTAFSGTCAGLSCRRFKYFKYDDIGRTLEEGVVYESGHKFDQQVVADDQSWPDIGLRQAKVTNQYSGGPMANRGKLTEQRVSENHSFDSNALAFVPDEIDIYSFTYDENGRIIENSYALSGLTGIHRFVYAYNRLGLVTQEWYENPTFDRQLYTDRWYDEWGRVKKVHSGTFAPYTKVFHGMKLDAAYSFDGIGRMYRKVLGATGDPTDPHLEYLDYSYDVRNRLSKLESNRFRMELGYDIRGNVLLQRWHHEQFDPDPNSWNQYRYQYDYLDRLIAADYSLVNFASGSSGGASGQRVGSSSFMPSTQAINGANIFASATDQYGTFDTVTDFNVLRNPQVDVVDYKEATVEKVEAEIEIGSAALGDFKVKEGVDEVIYVEAKVDQNQHWKTVADLEEEINTEEEVAVIEPAQKYDAWFRYDRVGNLQYLKRKLWDGIAVSVQQINYQYTAGLPNNQLLGTTGDYVANYSYDLNGNLTSDSEKGISGIEYDWRNMPLALDKGADQLSYRYDGGGGRIYKRIESVGTGSVEEEYYLGNVVVDQAGNLKRFGLAEGYAVYDSVAKELQRFYTITDWLGSNRVVFDEAGTTVMAADYYPYGLELGGRNYIADVESNRRKFTGHQRDHELDGIDYHGARYYNAVIGRYLSVDPLQAEFAAWSSYNYVLDNPIMYVDPDGMAPQKNGNTDGEKGKGSGDDREYQGGTLATVTIYGVVGNPTINGASPGRESLASGSEGQRVEFRSGEMQGKYVSHYSNSSKYVYHSGTKYTQRGWISPEAYEYATLDYAHGQVMLPRYWWERMFGSEEWPGRQFYGYSVDEEGYFTGQRHIPVKSGSGILELVNAGSVARILKFRMASKALRSGVAANPAKRGYTFIGHHFKKHFSRGGNWAKYIPAGARMNQATYNAAGLKAFKDIWKHPSPFIKEGVFWEKRLPDGRGMRLQEDLSFKGFLD